VEIHDTIIPRFTIEDGTRLLAAEHDLEPGIAGGGKEHECVTSNVWRIPFWDSKFCSHLHGHGMLASSSRSTLLRTPSNLCTVASQKICNSKRSIPSEPMLDKLRILLTDTASQGVYTDGMNQQLHIQRGAIRKGTCAMAMAVHPGPHFLEYIPQKPSGPLSAAYIRDG
jgi:hypothetical protein